MKNGSGTDWGRERGKSIKRWRMRKSCDPCVVVLAVNRVRCTYFMYLIASCVGVISGG